MNSRLRLTTDVETRVLTNNDILEIIKVLLNLRDGKSKYLADIPLVVDYLVEVSCLYPELSKLGNWLVIKRY